MTKTLLKLNNPNIYAAHNPDLDLSSENCEKGMLRVRFLDLFDPVTGSWVPIVNTPEVLFVPFSRHSGLLKGMKTHSSTSRNLTDVIDEGTMRQYQVEYNWE